jgi:hypothetical protein
VQQLLQEMEDMFTARFGMSVVVINFISIVRIPSVPRSDRSGSSRVGALSLVHFHPHVSLPPFIDSRLSLIASSSTTITRHLRTNHAPSRLHGPPPFLILPFPLCAYSLFLRTSRLGQRRSTLSRSCTALVRPPNTLLSPLFTDTARSLPPVSTT